MSGRLSGCLLAVVASGFAQVPTELARPPANARHFVIQSTGGKHGDSWSWVAADGTRRARESMKVRGQVFELESSGKAGADGMPSTSTVRRSGRSWRPWPAGASTATRPWSRSRAVPVVAGTDGVGIEIVRELEIYVRAGFSPAEALAAATIVPARLLGQDARTGSLKVGKTADLILVDGDPSSRIGDLRQTRVVMLDGKLLDADALRCAAGFSGRPR